MGRAEKRVIGEETYNVLSNLQYCPFLKVRSFFCRFGLWTKLPLLCFPKILRIIRYSPHFLLHPYFYLTISSVRSSHELLLT